MLKQFKNSSLQNYGLCPGHYCKILHMTKFELEFTGDLDIYLSFEKAGGVEFLTFLVDIVRLYLTLRLAALQRLGSSLFHSVTVDGKK